MIINQECVGKIAILRNGERLPIEKVIEIYKGRFDITFPDKLSRLYWYDGTHSEFENTEYDIIGLYYK